MDTNTIMEVVDTATEAMEPVVVVDAVKKTGGFKTVAAAGGLMIGGALLDRFVVTPVARKVKTWWGSRKRAKTAKVQLPIGNAEDVDMSDLEEIEDIEETYAVE